MLLERYYQGHTLFLAILFSLYNEVLSNIYCTSYSLRTTVDPCYHRGIPFFGYFVFSI